MMEKDQKNLKEATAEPMETEEDPSVGGASLEDPSLGEESPKGSLEWLLQELLLKYIPQTHPSCRQASCIWLLAVLKRCRTKPAIQKFLSQIQSAFMDLLADSNDLIQDAASKGLGVVYE
ncbi:UNVERIFIED_CONTAM: hypothetical protein GTU68_001152, partial [Idotea baltica]|nr:hypothetical protein [Idotea baltica]